MKYFVRDDHPAVFIADRVEKEVGEEEPSVDGDEGRNRPDDALRNQESAQHERGVFGKGKPDPAEYQEEKEPEVGELSYKA